MRGTEEEMRWMEDSQAKLGELELMLLLMVCILEGEGSGYAIFTQISAFRPGFVNAGTVYRTLHRLERKQLVCSSKIYGERQPGGRRRFHYVITPTGEASLRQTLRRLAALVRLASHHPVLLDPEAQLLQRRRKVLAVGHLGPGPDAAARRELPRAIDQKRRHDPAPRNQANAPGRAGALLLPGEALGGHVPGVA